MEKIVNGYYGKRKTDSASSEKVFQTGYLKLNKGFATWFSTFCENFCVQILKNHENKAKRPLPCFPVPYMPYFKWNVSFTKVLRMCSLTQVTILCPLWDCKNYKKIGKNAKKSSLGSKTQALHVWNNYSKLPLKYVMRCATWYHLYNLKNVKNIHGGVLLSVNLQAKSLYLYQK